MKAIARRGLLSGGLLCGAVLGLPRVQAQSGVWLVTGAEAALPPSATSKAGRAITRGPAIRQVSPAASVPANQPFTLRIEFAGRGGEKVDPATAQITILRGSDINITDRLKPYIKANGIEIPNAMVGAGTHALQVAVSDARGRQTIANIEIDAR